MSERSVSHASVATGLVEPDRPRRSKAPRNAAAMAMLAGVLNMLSAVFPEQRERLRAADILIPGDAAAGAFAVTTATGIGLLFLAGALRRRNRLAYLSTLVLLVGSAAAHVFKGLDIAEATMEAFFAGYLVGQGAEFRAHLEARERLSVVRPAVLVMVGTLAYGVVGLSVPHLGETIDASWWHKITDTAHMAIGLGSQLPLHHRFARFFPLSVAAAFYAGCFFVVARLLGPALHRDRPAAPLSAAEALASEDSLAWFGMRDDRRYVRSRHGVIAYGPVGAVALASGDPFGPREEWPEIIGAFLAEASRQGRVPAVLGCSADGAAAYREAGLTTRYLGDEAILELDGFTVDGGARKVARQSWNRAQRAGYRVTVQRSSSVADDVAQQIRRISNQWRGDEAERGFSMALGRLLSPQDADAVFVLGWDAEGSLAGFLHLVPWGRDGASLDVMRRDREGPGYFNDYLVVEAALQLPSLGIHRLSLNFSFLRAVVATEGERGVPRGLKVQRWVIRRLSGPFQIESLYRFNKKFAPEWQPRYFVLEVPEDLPRAVYAAMRAEGLVRSPFARLRPSASEPLPPGDDRGSVADP